jgi:DNA-binding IclR family transcriptional regulator
MLSILSTLSGGTASQGSVAKQSGLAKATVSRLVSSLSFEDIVIKDPVSAHCALGPGLSRVSGGLPTAAVGLATLARPVLGALNESTTETVVLHMRVGFERLCITELPSAQPIRYSESVGATAPIYVGSAGKTLLAAMEPDGAKQLIERVPLDPVTSKTVIDKSVLHQQLEDIRHQGWARSTGERVSGAAAFSVPVNAGAGLVLALSVLGPEARLPDESQESVVGQLRPTADALARLLTQDTSLVRSAGAPS